VGNNNAREERVRQQHSAAQMKKLERRDRRISRNTCFDSSHHFDLTSTKHRSHSSHNYHRRRAARHLGSGSSAVYDLCQYFLKTVRDPEDNVAISQALITYGEPGCGQIVSLIRQFAHALLYPRFDTRQKVVTLVGTIPIHYDRFGSTTYNLRVSIWLPPSFPQSCPIMFVEPVTSVGIMQKTMHSEVLKLLHVDDSSRGPSRIRHPIMDTWNDNGQQSTLVELIAQLCSVPDEIYLSESEESVVDLDLDQRMPSLPLSPAAVEKESEELDLGEPSEPSPVRPVFQPGLDSFDENAKAEMPLSPTMGLPDLPLSPHYVRDVAVDNNSINEIDADEDTDDETDDEENFEAMYQRRREPRKVTLGADATLRKHGVEIKEDPDDESDGDTVMEEMYNNENRKETAGASESDVISQPLMKLLSQARLSNADEEGACGDVQQRPAKHSVDEMMEIRVILPDHRLHTFQLKASDTFWGLNGRLMRKVPELASSSFVFRTSRQTYDETQFDQQLSSIGLGHREPIHVVY